MKKKWFRSMDLVDDEFIEEANPARGATPLRKKRIITTLVASAACLAITLTGLWYFLPKEDTPPVIDQPPSMEQQDKESYDAVIEKLSAYKELYDTPLKGEDIQIDAMRPNAGPIGPTVAVPDAVAPGDRGDENYTGSTNDGSTYEEITDNQVEGITEADRIKRSSTHIYYLDRNTLKIFDIAGLDSKKVGSVFLDESYQYRYYSQWEFYLSTDCKTATVLTRYENAEKQRCVGVISIDVSDPTNPTVKNKVEITGNYLSSRMTDGKLLLMTELVLDTYRMDFEKEETFLPQINGKSIPCDCIIVPEEVDSPRYTVVLKLDENTLAIEGQSAALSYSEHIYVSKDHIFLTRVYADVEPLDEIYRIRKAMTEITALSYKDEFEKKGSVCVRGYVKDQWSMDEYEGILRVVTTTNSITGYIKTSYTPGYMLQRPSNESSASLYCIDLEEFKVIASVENFAPLGEDVRSVRFDKSTAYVCTAIQVTDPVYFFDLSDLNNITYKETGNIDGFSTSLINMGDGYLLGIGQEDWNTFKVEVYKETETGVVGFCKYTQRNITYSTDYKSYLVDRENQLIGLGIFNNNGGDKNGSRYILLHFNGNELEELADVELPGNDNMKRAVYIDGFLYLFGENAFQVIDVYNQPEKPEEPEETREVDKIVDLTKENNITYETNIEFWCEDEEYRYFFGGERGRYINVYYADGSEENVLSALEKGHITIQDLDRFGIDYYIKSKQ